MAPMDMIDIVRNYVLRIDALCERRLKDLTKIRGEAWDLLEGLSERSINGDEIRKEYEELKTLSRELSLGETPKE